MIAANQDAPPLLIQIEGSIKDALSLKGLIVLCVGRQPNYSDVLYNMRQGEGIRYETLFRDETVEALDAVKAKSTSACCAGLWTWVGSTR